MEPPLFFSHEILFPKVNAYLHWAALFLIAPELYLYSY